MEKLLVEEAMETLKISSEEDLEKSNRLRINGNVLYKDGNLEFGEHFSYSFSLVVVSPGNRKNTAAKKFPWFMATGRLRTC